MNNINDSRLAPTNITNTKPKAPSTPDSRLEGALSKQRAGTAGTKPTASSTSSRNTTGGLYSQGTRTSEGSKNTRLLKGLERQNARLTVQKANLTQQGTPAGKAAKAAAQKPAQTFDRPAPQLNIPMTTAGKLINLGVSIPAKGGPKIPGA